MRMLWLSRERWRAFFQSELTARASVCRRCLPRRHPGGGRVKYEHLFLKDWPFSLVPSDERALVWADRAQLREGVTRALRRMNRVTATSLLLLWADFGAGKTHTLKYLEAACRRDHQGLLPGYSALPKGLKSFLDLYREIVAGLDAALLGRLLTERCAGRSFDKVVYEDMHRLPDLGFALRAIHQGSERDKAIALQWLRAVPGQSMAQLRTVGVGRKIQTTDDAIAALTTICRLVAGSDQYHRIVILIDEFQRASQVAPKILAEINAGLHTLYNSCPDGLSLVLSFSCGSVAHLELMLSPELLDRAPLTDPLTMPEMTRDDGVSFVTDLLAAYRLDGAPTATFPYTPAALEAVVDHIQSSRSLTLKPRTLMKVMDEVTLEADEAIELGRLTSIDEQYVRSVLGAVGGSGLADDRED